MQQTYLNSVLYKDWEIGIIHIKHGIYVITCKVPEVNNLANEA